MSALTVTVSQLNRYLKAVLEEDRKLQGIFLKGEISGFTRHYKSGHCYFALKDEGASVRAVMFRSHAESLRFEPKDGMAVLAQGSVGVYERDGAYQFYVVDMQPDGAGAMAVAFEQLKAKLTDEGLFDARHKKPLPPYPRRIGVVTSETGAALQDILHILARRYPLAAVALSPAVVQGAAAPDSIVRALRAVDRDGGCDVVIVGRGGGSAEDLSCFSDERVARTVFAMKTPVVSAVGHETDYTICDFVADLRAPTPSAAAELVTPSGEELRKRLVSTAAWFRRGAEQTLESAWQRLDKAASHPVLRVPGAWIGKNKERLDFLSTALYNRGDAFVCARREGLARRCALLDSLSPLRVLDRGYCLAFRDGEPVSSVLQLAPGSELTVRFRDGAAQAAVTAATTWEDKTRNEKKYDV